MTVEPASLDPRRAVLGLAVPAFLTLIAEPLFLLADSAIVGHLGTAELAGLGVASAALSTAAGLFVFLAYGTTALVSRALGAGGERQAIAAGLDGVWLALALGAVVAPAVALTAPAICAAFGASAAGAAQAAIYLRISALGLPGMLLSLAATGILRGLADTRTPLIATTAGFGTNLALNLWFVRGLGWGIAGSAWGTVLAQTGMALGIGAVVIRAALRRRALARPHPAGVLRAARGGLPLLVRTLALRAVLLLTTWLAARLGDVPLAAYQVSATVWTFLSFALDALAIAGQSLTGHALGAGDVKRTRTLTRLMTRWGLGAGVLLGMLLLLAHDLLPTVFTADDAVRQAIAAALIVVALGQPISGVAFVLDGILIGAGDARWLARAQVGLLLAYVPVVACLYVGATPVRDLGARWAVMALWAGFTVFMALRAVVLHARQSSDAWLVTGA